MTEPFYGSMASSPIWSGIAPTYGFFQSPAGIGMSHAEGFGGPIIPQAPSTGLPAVGPVFASSGGVPGLAYPGHVFPPHGFAPGFMSPALSGLPFGQQPIPASTGPFPATGGQPGYSGFEVPPGITATALLAIVAMRRGQPQGPANDQEIEEFIYDALELLPGTNDVEVRVEGGRVTLTGGVQQKRLKRDVGEIAWAIPSVNDVVNNVTIATRRRTRATGREAEPHQPVAPGRKQA
jgi:hypothetical protein